MTRQEMNDIILQSFQTELQDKPDVASRIGDIYSQWVQGLIQQGTSQLVPQTTQEMGNVPKQEPAQGE